MPRVSQYRLAAHLSSAVVLYSVLFWNAKEILAPAWKMAPEKVTPALAQLRKMVISSKALVFLTLVSGGFIKLSSGSTLNIFYNCRSICCWSGRWSGVQQFSQVRRQVDTRGSPGLQSSLEEHH